MLLGIRWEDVTEHCIVWVLITSFKYTFTQNYWWFLFQVFSKMQQISDFIFIIFVDYNWTTTSNPRANIYHAQCSPVFQIIIKYTFSCSYTIVKKNNRHKMLCLPLFPNWIPRLIESWLLCVVLTTYCYVFYKVVILNIRRYVM